MNKKIFIILIIAFLLRIISLNQSLWLDEATTAKVIQTYSYSDIIFKFSPFDFHPPLYYLFMKLWTFFIGYSEIALRLPSVLFSLFAGYVLYKIGELIKKKNIGLWAMIFFLFNPLIVYYSQEARMYMMTVFLLTASLYYFIHLCHPEFISGSGSRNKFGMTKALIKFNIFSILAFVTFYGSIFFIGAMLFILLIQKKYIVLLKSLILNFLSLIFISPLLFQQFSHSREALIYVSNWNLVLGKASIKNLLLIPLKFSIGRISFEPKWLYYLFGAGWTVFVFSTIKTILRKDTLLWMILFILPLIIGGLFSFISPLLQYFRFLYGIVPMSILLGITATKKWRQFVLLAGFVLFSLLYISMPQFHREDWKSVAESLVNNHTVYMILDSSDPLKYYTPMLSIKELRTLDQIELEKEVTVIPYTADIYGFDYRKALRQRGFMYKETKHFRGVWYEIWVKNKIYAGSFLNSFKAI